MCIMTRADDGLLCYCFAVQNTMNGQNLQVSASTFMPSQGKLACGRTDGSIVLIPAVETIVLHLLDGGQELGPCCI